jgi:hypothetical protein
MPINGEQFAKFWKAQSAVNTGPSIDDTSNVYRYATKLFHSMAVNFSKDTSSDKEKLSSFGDVQGFHYAMKAIRPVMFRRGSRKFCLAPDKPRPNPSDLKASFQERLEIAATNYAHRSTAVQNSTHRTGQLKVPMETLVCELLVRLGELPFLQRGENSPISFKQIVLEPAGQPQNVRAFACHSKSVSNLVKFLLR